MTALARKISRGKVVILSYKRIVDGLDQVHKYPVGSAIAQAAFQQHLEFLSDHFNIIGLGEYCRRYLTSEPINNPTAILTFDNGYENIFRKVAPLLEDRKIAGTVFLPPSLIGTMGALDQDRACGAALKILARRENLMKRFPDEKMPADCSFVVDLIVANLPQSKFIQTFVKTVGEIKENAIDESLNWLEWLGQPDADSKKEPNAVHLNWDQVKELTNMGWELGCQDDDSFRNDPIEDISNDEPVWVRRFRAIQRKTQKTPVAFSHGPKGLNEIAIRSAKKAGFICAVTDIRGKADKEKDLFFLPRIVIGQHNAPSSHRLEKLLSFVR